jgi:hypothetical protein
LSRVGRKVDGNVTVLRSANLNIQITPLAGTNASNPSSGLGAYIVLGRRARLSRLCPDERCAVARSPAPKEPGKPRTRTAVSSGPGYAGMRLRLPARLASPAIHTQCTCARRPVLRVRERLLCAALPCSAFMFPDRRLRHPRCLENMLGRRC